MPMNKPVFKPIAAFLCLCVLLSSLSLASFGATEKKVSSLKAEAVSSGDATLKWKKLSGADGYEVSLFEQNKLAAKKKTKKLSCKAKSLKPGTVYSFSVTAYCENGGKKTFFGKSEKKRFLTKPEAVSSLSATPGENSVKLSWPKSSGAVQYRVFKKDNNGKSVLLKTTTKTSLSIGGLSFGQKESFAVCAVSKSGKLVSTGKKSKFVLCAAKPQSPSNLKAATSARDGVALEWKKALGADGYEIFRFENGKYKLIEDTAQGCSFIDENLKSGTYTYKVRAYLTVSGKKIYSPSSALVSHEFVRVKEPENPYDKLGKFGQAGVLGFLYNEKGQYFYTAEDPWQRNFGYNVIYDITAPGIVIDFDTVRFKFESEGKDWMIQLWKGQYGMVFYGGEIGVYTKPKNRSYKHYDCASKDDTLKITFDYYEREWNGTKRVWNKKFTRPYGTYWWCTGFIPGNSGLNYKDLKMDIRITVKDFEMLRGFTAALSKKGFDFKVSGLDVFFEYN